MILNKTTKSRDRYKVLPGSAGNYGDPANSPTHKFMVVEGVDRGNGYQGYSSVAYVLLDSRASHFPAEARRNLIQFLASKGYGDWLAENGIAVPATAKRRR